MTRLLLALGALIVIALMLVPAVGVLLKTERAAMQKLECAMSVANPDAEACHGK